MLDNPSEFLASLFDVAVAAAMPSIDAMPLPEPAKGKTIVIGAGKGAAAMAKVVEDNWQGGDLGGIVITRYQHGLNLKKIRVIEAGHPVPDSAGKEAAEEILKLVSSLGEDDQVICLISGGGSALLSLPADGVSLSSKQTVNKSLLKSGASISEINTVRKKLSAVKGGRLAVAAWPAKMMTYLISDVPGDDQSVIASGPTVPDETTSADAKAVLLKYGITPPEDVSTFLETAAAETPDVDHPAFKAGAVHMIATPHQSLVAVTKKAEEAGLSVVSLGDSIEGEAAEVARVMAGITRYVKERDLPVAKPCLIISGGETTVTVKSDAGETGRGGRNAEFLLSLTKELDGMEGVYAIAADTDGIDGTEDNAGAIMRPDTIARAHKKGISAAEYLARHDAYSFFDALGDLVKTGPTRTNVNDFRAILIL
ncbi:DUF4147 domain-containing protein [Sneathiella sp. P13V-1]|uniref:glycerate kinase type-2 family protein n=1 Tax=Sneathiella sp. P13V-1 TaxID=2697366 RepID=UPI00187BA019|nr:glycerate kinase [Sneathiella sp. P13V-1]MBE7637819.1 DUF4147 domain-containing protein [Sneathiella sp. P13V-1]